MKKFWAIICTVAMLVVTITVAGVQDPNAGDIDGDINRNPWEDLFTTATTKEETTSLVETTTLNESTPGVEETTPAVETTPAIETTPTIIRTENPSSKDLAQGIKVGKTKVEKAVKKQNSKKILLKLKKVKDAKKYQIQISKQKRFKKILVRKTVKKVKVKITSKRVKNKSKLYVRARAVKIVNHKKYFGKWSKAKRIKIERK